MPCTFSTSLACFLEDSTRLDVAAEFQREEFHVPGCWPVLVEEALMQRYKARCESVSYPGHIACAEKIQRCAQRIHLPELPLVAGIWDLDVLVEVGQDLHT